MRFSDARKGRSDFEPPTRSLNSHISRRCRLVGEGKVPVNMSDVKRAKYSLSVQGQPDCCHFCKCYVQSHSNSKRNHEQSNAHKKNVELKMREIRKQKQNEGKEEEAKERMMASIESAAAQAYKADLAAGARPEDAGKVPTLSAGARQPLSVPRSEHPRSPSPRLRALAQRALPRPAGGAERALEDAQRSA